MDFSPVPAGVREGVTVSPPLVAPTMTPTVQSDNDPYRLIPPELARELRNVYASNSQVNELQSLASFVTGQMCKAINVRAGITQRLINATYSLQQRYPPAEEQRIMEDQQPCIHMGIVANKVRTVSAWLKDIMTNSTNKIWTLEATPKPEVPEELRMAVFEQVANELQAGMPPDMIQSLMAVLLPIVEEKVKEAADQSAANMERYIHDMLTESNLAHALSCFIDDLAAYPYAVMGGPFITPTRKIKYGPRGAEEVVDATMTVRHVNATRFYWSADSTTCQDGEFVIEYGAISTNALHDSIKIPGFVETGILEVLASNYNFLTSTYRDIGLEMLQKRTYTELGSSSVYPVIKYYGLIPALFLINHGIAVEDAVRDTEVEIWTIGNIVVRVVQNPYPLQRRPYYLTSWNKTPGSMVGSGLHDMLHDVERMANAAARNLVKNMSFGAGPITEVDESRLKDGDRNITDITPYRVYRVGADYGGFNNPAFRFNVIPTVSDQLMAVYSTFNGEADRISGLNNLLLGQVDLASSSRTASGLSMLIANAAKVLKNSIGNVDRDIINPMITAFYNWIILYDSTFTDKVDAQVVAYGASGALQREMSQTKMIEMLQLVTPYVQFGIIPPDSILRMIRDILEGAGMNADRLIPLAADTTVRLQNALQRGMIPPQTGMMQAPNTMAGLEAPGSVTDQRMIPNPV